MFTLDLREFDRAIHDFAATLDQVPFALAQAMNDGVEFARDEIINRTWPGNVAVRNPRFLQAALTTRGNRATKTNLRVAIDDRLGRASLGLHAEGGEKTPRGKAIAVPSAAVAGRAGAKGVPKGLRPRALPNSFVKGNAIYQRVGTYQKVGAPGTGRSGVARGKGYDGRGLTLMYRLAPRAEIRADVPFDSDFERAMRAGVDRAFGPRLQRAMATRR